jgi:hypothetical protein
VNLLPGGRRHALVALAALLFASCGATPTATPSPSPSVPDAAPSAAPSASTAALPSTSAPPVPGHELYGFVPYWEMDGTIAAHLAATPLTTVGLFSVTNTSNGQLDARQTGYKRITGGVGAQMIAAAHRRGTRVEIVFTSFGAKRNEQFFGHPALQDATIASLVSIVGRLGIDGVDVDVEGLDIARAADFGSFVGRLRSAVTLADPSHSVTVATGSGPTGAAMAAAAVAAGADRAFLMGYDYRTATSSPGATSPIDRADGGRSLTWSLDLYASMGIPPQKLLLGLPLYGISWPVAGPVLGAPATGNGQTYILRRNLALLTNPAAVPVNDPLEGVDIYFVGSDGSVAPPGLVQPSASPSDPSASGSPSPPLLSASPMPAGTTWTAVYVDSPDTLARKLGLGESRDLAGAGFWAIGYERGLPAYTDLMTRYVAGEVPAS